MEGKKTQKIGKFDFLKDKKFQKQITLYLIFAVCMIILNLLIQLLNEAIAPVICANIGHIEIIHLLYCIESPDMSELVGSVVAVGITYIIKFLLDKFLIFKTEGKIKQSTKEFVRYFGFAIVISIIFIIGIQFILSNIFGVPLLISAVIVLVSGYLIKFFLDRKYVFTND